MIGRVIVALVVALAMPAVQLRLIEIDRACCCPDPDHCRCPSHDADGPQTSLRACHSTEVVTVSPHLTPFVPPAITAIVLPVVATSVPPRVIDQPHPAPLPRRPDAPS